MKPLRGSSSTVNEFFVCMGKFKLLFIGFLFFKLSELFLIIFCLFIINENELNDVSIPSSNLLIGFYITYV